MTNSQVRRCNYRQGDCHDGETVGVVATGCTALHRITRQGPASTLPNDPSPVAHAPNSQASYTPRSRRALCVPHTSYARNPLHPKNAMSSRKTFATFLTHASPHCSYKLMYLS